MGRRTNLPAGRPCNVLCVAASTSSGSRSSPSNYAAGTWSFTMPPSLATLTLSLASSRSKSRRPPSGELNWDVRTGGFTGGSDGTLGILARLGRFGAIPFPEGPSPASANSILALPSPSVEGPPSRLSWAILFLLRSSGWTCNSCILHALFVSKVLLHPSHLTALSGLPPVGPPHFGR